MEIKIVHKIIILVFYIFLFCPFAKGQNKRDTVNIVFRENLKHCAKIVHGDSISFYIDRETFVFIKSKDNKMQVFKEKNVKKDTFSSVNEILEKLYRIDKQGTIHISKKSECFALIYLYEFRGCLIYRYPVKWENSISDWEF